MDEFVERVARRVVELLDQRDGKAAGLVDAATLARLLGVSRSTVYDNAAKLGGVQVGNGGRRPRLRFDPERAREAWTVRVPGESSQNADVPAPAKVRRRSKRAGSGSGVRLLPVRGRSGVEGGDATSGAA